MRRKKERSKQGQTNKQGKATQHTQGIFPRKNELPRVGLEPTTLYTLDRALYQLSYRGSSADRAQLTCTCTCICSCISYEGFIHVQCRSPKEREHSYSTECRIAVCACTCCTDIHIIFVPVRPHCMWLQSLPF